MRALAIVAPHIAEAHLAPFRVEQVELRVVEQISASTSCDAALIFGGDGTIHRHLPELAETRIPVLVVPRGSGNDFAVSLGLRRPEDAIAAWRKFVPGGGNVRAIDLGVIAECKHEPSAAQHWFCCIAGAGLDSETNRRANAMPRWLRSHGGYVLGALASIALFRPPAITLSMDSPEAISQPGAPAPQPKSQPATLVAFANAPAYGHGMRMAPRAQLDDGKLDVCFVRRTSRLRLLRFFPTVFSGRHLEMPEVDYFRTARLRVEADRPLDVFADGEYICRTPVEVSVRPGALQVIVP